jgi:uncharacterized membrane protein
MEPEEKPVSSRIPAIDVARGGALVGMALYHLSWDCAYFHLAPTALPTLPPMRLFSHLVAGAFLALAGLSLALAHRNGPDWRAFWRRLAVVGGAAALVTAATFLLAPEETIVFGIIHCIAAVSLVAAPLLRLSPWIALGVGALLAALPLGIADPALDAPALFWLGLGTTPPSTLDWRPLTPWAGVVLISLALARMNLARLLASPLARWRPAVAGARALAWAGRRSLAIYLIHQPVLFSLLFAVASLTGASARWEAAQFAEVCERECVQGGGAAEICTMACGCVLRGLQQAGLSQAIARSGKLDAAQSEEYSRVVRACAVRPAPTP